jgi:hypothetical protein
MLFAHLVFEDESDLPSNELELFSPETSNFGGSVLSFLVFNSGQVVLGLVRQR